MRVGMNEFVELLKPELEKQTGCEVVTGEMKRLHGKTSYRGLLVLGKEEVSWPLLFLDRIIVDYWNGRGLDSIVEELCLENEKRKTGNEIGVYFYDLEKSKPNFCYQLVNKQNTLTFSEGRPKEFYLDLVKQYGVLTEEKKGWRIFLDIRNTHLERWGISEQELKQQAEQNMKSLLPVRKETIRDSFPGKEAELDVFLKGVKGEELADHLLTLTNSLQFYGATVMTYKGVLEEIAEQWEDHLMISPSSVHDITVRPLKRGYGMTTCVEALHERNLTQRKSEEILSNHVYLYERGTGHLIVV